MRTQLHLLVATCCLIVPSTVACVFEPGSPAPRDRGSSTADPTTTSDGAEGGQSGAPSGSDDSDTPGSDGPLSTGPKRVFVTSVGWSGNLRYHGQGSTGPRGADNLCNTVAAAANLPGTYVAWVSTPAVHAISRIRATGPWIDPSGETIFENRAQLLTLPKEQFIANENGEMNVDTTLWTGTTNSGLAKSATCNGWASEEPIYFGSLGDPRSMDSWSDNRRDALCSERHRLICFEQ